MSDKVDSAGEPSSLAAGSISDTDRLDWIEDHPEDVLVEDVLVTVLVGGRTHALRDMIDRMIRRKSNAQIEARRE